MQAEFLTKLGLKSLRLLYRLSSGKESNGADEISIIMVRSLVATGFTQNLTKLLMSSMPPQRPTGSWIYKDAVLTEVASARVNRRIPRFNPMQYIQ